MSHTRDLYRILTPWGVEPIIPHMGLFRAEVEIANPTERDFRRINPVVDTGATYSMLPASLLETLGLSPTEERHFELADGESRSYGLGEIRFKIDDRERTTPVIFGPDNVYLLGAVSLESFGLIADTTQQRLIPSPRLYLVGIRQMNRYSGQ